MEVVVKDNKSIELELGDVVEIISKYNDKYFFLVERIYGENKFILRQFDENKHFGGECNSLDEIIEILNKDKWIKEYKIYSQKYYKIVIEPK
jgi:hypothetical protein